MEHLLSNKMIATLKRALLIALILITAMSSCIVAFGTYWIRRRTAATASAAAADATATVLRAYLISKISGEYWYNEMHVQAQTISQLPQSDRIVYYQTILLSTDLHLSGEGCLQLCQLLTTDDVIALYQKLLAMGSEADHEKLSIEEKQKISQWIKSLKIITQIKGKGLPC